MLVAGIVLVVVALTTAVVMPRILTSAAWTIRRPRTALASWCASVVVGLVSFVGGITVVVLDGRRAADLAAGTAGGTHLLVAIAAVLAFVVAVRVRPGVEQAAVREAIRTGAAPRRRIDGTRVAIVEADHALACAVPGREGGVLLSTGLASRLTEDELAAVVAHEAAHLRERHDLLVGVAESIERAVPWVPGARAMARSTRVLVELAADDAAARRVGRDALRRAITASAITASTTSASGTSTTSGSALAAVRTARLTAPGVAPSA